MLQFWTTWNGLWFLSAKYNFLPFSNGLKASICITSLLGGFMTYVYPRKLTIKYNNSKIPISYHYMVLSDIFFHQLPLFYIFYLNPYKDRKYCAMHVFVPFYWWNLYNYCNDTDVDKIYGVKMYKLCSIGASAFFSCGIWYHSKKFK